MAAVTQVAHRHSEGRVYYDRKLKEGKSNKEALRCLKRRISDAIFAHLVADAKRRAQSHPHHTTYGHVQRRKGPRARREEISKSLLTTKRSRSVRAAVTADKAR